MGAELAQRIALAHIEARRRRHDATSPEHLLAVVLGSPEVVHSLHEHSLDPDELRDRLEGRLSEVPAIGGYRDGEEPPRSASLARVLTRLERRDWRRLGARTGLLFGALRVGVDAALASARAGTDPEVPPRLDRAVKDVIGATQAMAQRLGAIAATIRQLCLELARHDDAKDLWSAAGIDAAAFVRAVHLPDDQTTRARGLLR